LDAFPLTHPAGRPFRVTVRPKKREEETGGLVDGALEKARRGTSEGSPMRGKLTPKEGSLARQDAGDRVG